MSSIIWFIRHAECEINIGLPTSTTLNAQLTSKGLIQALQVALAFSKAPDLIITSAYKRSKQTAIPTLQRFPDARHEEWPVHEFTYLAKSLGQEITNIHERRSLVEKYWQKLDLTYVDGDGAESFKGFMRRANSTLELLKQRDEDFIAVFTHGQFILAILSQLIGLNFENMLKFRYFLLANEIPNGAILKVDIQNEDLIWFSPFITSHLI